MVQETLEQRGEVYGDYKGSVSVRSEIMAIIVYRYVTTHGKIMPKSDEIRIYDIVNKISRLAVSPKHIDTWLDIAGYATLAKEELDEQD